MTILLGMNFFEQVAGLTSWTSSLAFGLAMTVFICLPIVMLQWMKRRTWV
jgi:hypothetical protein